MKYQVFLLLLTGLSITITAKKAPTSRIVGGSDAADAQFPYQVFLTKEGSFYCGGSIIHQRYVLTAAHCLDGTLGLRPTYLKVIAGTNRANALTGTVYDVDFYVRHLNFIFQDPNSIGANYDIGLIRVARDIIFTKRIQKIDLPRSENETYDNEMATLTGWGQTTVADNAIPEELQHIKLKIVDNETCNKTWMGFANQSIDDSKICTGSKVGQGPCYGDSGGPLVVNGTQVGIVSYGWPCATGVPDVFTRVTSYLKWIQSKTYF